MLPEAITTSRLVLRPFRFADVPEFFAYLQEPDMGRFLEGSRRPPTEEEAARIGARNILADRDERCVWAITIDEVVVGAITISFEKNQRIAEIGYSVKKPLWGQGITSEAARAVVDTAFEHMPDLQRIQASIHPQNAASIRAAANAGLVYEATLRAYSFVDGEISDEVICALVRSDWAPSQDPKR